jgi:uncharacterized protein YerC
VELCNDDLYTKEMTNQNEVQQLTDRQKVQTVNPDGDYHFEYDNEAAVKTVTVERVLGDWRAMRPRFLTLNNQVERVLGD